jgi:hypothetical protein
MTTTGEKVHSAIDSSKHAAQTVIDKAKNVAHAVGKAVEKQADEVATVAGKTLETVGHQMKDTTKHSTHDKK